MCGIVGIRRFDGGAVHQADLRLMAAQLDHRGPDGEGYWVDGPVGFGHRRLSIIDVAGSPQPMASAGDRYHVSFNGEILNYQDLRRRLPYPYRTSGDTEVLLAAFSEWGAAGVQQLHGQFAYSLYDRDAATLWLFRDRLGILPLYYYADADVLLFASEIKALLPMLPAPAELDEDSLFAYLGAGSVPAPNTLFRGVRKLPQGHWLRVGPDGWVTTHRYWEIPADGDELDVTDTEAVDLVGAALERSVDAALVADVPVGAYLSGGLDSSLVVALMAKAAGQVDTFSAGFGDPRYDELAHARRVSELFGTRHEEVVVTPADFERLWPELTWNRDAPMSQPADAALHLLAATARRRVKVVLSGEGSDELFGGYPKDRVARWAAMAGRVPAAARTPLLDAAQRRLPARANRVRVAARAVAEPSRDEQIAGWFAPFTTAERRRLLGDRAAPATPALWVAGRGDPLRRMLYADCHQWLADNLLERGDRMSMAASLELRPPFLDHRLVELAFSLPSRMKVRRSTGKWVVKELARRHLPPAIVDRPKVGFRVPLDEWFRGALRPMAADLLDSPSSFVGQVMDRAAVRALLDSHARGRTNEEMRIWTLLSLEVWHNCYFGTGRARASAA
jgi:asparagine synthase (glutamine-hydrolysing)